MPCFQEGASIRKCLSNIGIFLLNPFAEIILEVSWRKYNGFFLLQDEDEIKHVHMYSLLLKKSPVLKK